MTREFRFVHLGVVVALSAAVVTSSLVVRSAGAAGAGGGVASAFVPITPCRLADTRAGADHVGSVTGPIKGQQSVTFAVWGSNGLCSIPSSATAIATNVTAVGPSAASFVTVFPADASPRPLAANLNVVAGGAPTPNQVTVGLSAAGAIAAFNNSGSLDLVIDVVGFYTAVSGVGPSGVISVAKSGGQFTSVKAAMDSITDGASHVIEVGPGTFVESEPIVMKALVDLVGSGQKRTVLTCSCGEDATRQLTRATVVVSGDIDVEIRDLTVTNTNTTNVFSTALLVNDAGASVSVVDTTLTATASATDGNARGAFFANSDVPHIDGINVFVSGAASNVGVTITGSPVVIRNSWIYISGPGFSVQNVAPSARLVTSTVNGNTSGMSGECDLVLTVVVTPYTCL
jgi:hypothetical protein